MTAGKSSAKRKRKEEETGTKNSNLVSDKIQSKRTVFNSWLDDGCPIEGDDDDDVDVVEHERCSITIDGTTHVVSKGSTVLMRSIEEESNQLESSSGVLVARVERLWQEEMATRSSRQSGTTYMFQARWFLLVRFLLSFSLLHKKGLYMIYLTPSIYISIFLFQNAFSET